MSSENILSEQEREEFLGENSNLPGMNSDLNDKTNSFSKEKGKRGMRLAKTKIKTKPTLGPGTTYDQCFSNGNFGSQYEDECPVNYSLKYSETESTKAVSKCESGQKKFKDFAEYVETDSEQPTNFSLKYAEKTFCDDNKRSAFNYYNSQKVKFKGYSDYLETDLDQPTDFTLKYRESAEEEVNFYGNEEQKTSSGFGSRTTSEAGASSERLPERYTSQNETPLMFSRSSSMNSLSSFAHITQSIPDDRSSIVSDFSRVTSGIISPSELPDSPTQISPSSPKSHKPFVAKPDFLSKQSVFEDDVATYKQEGTPVEFSRAASVSSSNIYNPVKSELLLKRNSASLNVSKEENRNALDHVDSEHLKTQIEREKSENEKGKLELASVLEVDESLFTDCISIDIQINCRKPESNYSRLVPQENNNLRRTNGFPIKPNLRLRIQNENKKSYSTYEDSDDAVHTYHTEGTPANVSHAGSHSDLSALSSFSGMHHLGVDDNFDSEAFFPEHAQTVPAIKAESLKNKVKIFTESQPVTLNINQSAKREVFVNDQSQLDYLGKDHHQFTAKDETATFATENSPCDISIRSSLNDLTVNVVDETLTINRVETCEEPPSQMLSPLRNVSPQSPNSLVFEEAEDVDVEDGEDVEEAEDVEDVEEVEDVEGGEKCPEEQQNEFLQSDSTQRLTDSWNCPSEVEEKPENILKTEESCSSTESVDVVALDLDSTQPLTLFEEALVEECIRLGMPQKKSQKSSPAMHNKIDNGDKPSENRQLGECNYAKNTFDDSKCLNGKKIIPGRKGNNLNPHNLDFDSREPLTPFEEVLLEQCILLGMPQKKNHEKVKVSHLTYSDEGTQTVDCDPSELITPLETALLEQCIRLGMPQRKTQKKEPIGEPARGMSSLAAQLNRLKLNPETIKDKFSFKKCEHCSLGKKQSNRKKNTCCKPI